MKKNVFYNDLLNEKILVKKNFSQLSNVNPKRNVDINKLLNEIKIDQKIEKKKIFIFFSLGFLLLGLMGTFVVIIK